MPAPLDNIVQHLFHQPSLHSVTVYELENLATAHPYFAAAHFLLLKKMQDTDHPSFTTQLHKTTVYFDNPLWLQYLLQPNSSPVVSGTATSSLISSDKERIVAEKEPTNSRAEPIIDVSAGDKADDAVNTDNLAMAPTSEGGMMDVIREMFSDPNPLYQTETDAAAPQDQVAEKNPAKNDDSITAPGENSTGAGREDVAENTDAVIVTDAATTPPSFPEPENTQNNERLSPVAAETQTAALVDDYTEAPLNAALETDKRTVTTETPVTINEQAVEVVDDYTEAPLNVDAETDEPLATTDPPVTVDQEPTAVADDYAEAPANADLDADAQRVTTAPPVDVEEEAIEMVDEHPEAPLSLNPETDEQYVTAESPVFAEHDAARVVDDYDDVPLHANTTTEQGNVTQQLPHTDDLATADDTLEKDETPAAVIPTLSSVQDKAAPLATMDDVAVQHADHGDNAAPGTAAPLPIFQKMPDTPDAKNDLVFEPYHTVDYFASQGIKLSKVEVDAKDKLGSQLKSFTAWLKSMKKLPQVSIDNILAQNEESKVVADANHSLENKEVITEAMAEVFEKQQLHGQAAEIYRKLSLLNPSKSAYFAARIDALKN